MYCVSNLVISTYAESLSIRYWKKDRFLGKDLLIGCRAGQTLDEV